MRLGWLTKLTDKQYILALIVVAIVTHILWFNPSSTLFHVDWLHWSDAAAQQAFHSLGTWSSYFGIGAPRAQISFSFVENFWSLFGALGMGFDTAVKLTILIPIAILSFVAPYLAMRQFTSNKFVCFVCAMFYASTTYLLLRERSHLQIAFVDVFAPILFVLFVNALRSMKTRAWIWFALAFALGLCYELRIMYITTFILGLYALLFFPKANDAKKLPKQLAITGLTILALSSFWLLPTVMGGIGSSISEITDRSLFGDWLFDLPHAIALSVSSWTGGAPVENFEVQPIKPYLWLIPLVAFLSLVIITRSKATNVEKKKQVIFFAILAIVGIFLTKQSLDPLPGAYTWLYENFPGFSLFREASKFYLLTMWGYMGLIGLGLAYFASKNKKAFYTLSVAILGVAVINLTPLVTGEIGGLSVSHEIPSDYQKLNTYIAKNKEYSRTLWVPSGSQWAYFDATHPMVSISTIMNQNWKPLYLNLEGSTHNRVSSLLNQPHAKEVLGSSSVRLIVVPSHDNVSKNNDPFKAYGNNRQYYIDTLSRIPWLKRLDIGTKNVAIFENTNYQPHIKTSTALYAFSSFEDMGKTYDFSTTNVATASSFTLGSKQNIPTTDIHALFSDTTAENFSNGSVKVSTTSRHVPILYANTNTNTLSYRLEDGELGLIGRRVDGLKVNGQQIIDRQDSSTELGSTTFNASKKYGIVIDDTYIPIDPASTPNRTFGLATKSTRIVANAGPNIIPNPSFEEGPWNTKAHDCDNFDDRPAISMRINSTEKTEGKNSIELNAGNHSVCAVTTQIPVVGGSEYLLSFDYKDSKPQNADKVGYRVLFNDKKDSKTEKFLIVRDGSWHRVHEVIKVPDNTTTIQLELIGFPRVQIPNRTKTFYDNVSLNTITTELESGTDLRPYFEKITLKDTSNQFEYNDLLYNAKNLVPNPSLEDGLWKDEVGDCNAYDDKPDLKMSLSTIASDKNQSLELAARSHIACTGPPAVPVNEGETYLFSFDSQSPNVSSARYTIAFDDADTTTITGTTKTDNNWQPFNRLLNVPIGARNLKITVYANSKEGSNKYTINRFDNFKLIAVPNIHNQFYLVEPPAKALNQPKKIDYQILSPTKKTVKINGANGPFYLTMSEAYNARWRLELDNSKISGLLNSWAPGAKPDTVLASNHIKWNGFMNGWYVDPVELCKSNAVGCAKASDGTYDIDLMIEFSPQRWMNIGYLITASTILCCIGYFVYDRSRQKKSQR